MDDIQEALIKAGRKDLAQQYYKKIADVREYDDSTQFTADLEKVEEHIQEIQKIIQQPRWDDWMKQSDESLTNNCVRFNKQFIDGVKIFEKLKNELDNAA